MAQADEFDLGIDGQALKLRWFAPRATPHAPVIVLLHQGLGSITQWRSFPAALAAATDCAVLAYDRLGHGRSARIEGPRQPDFLDREAMDVLPAILDAVGIDRPILYGHSDGATIALMFAAAFPDRPQAVISEAAHVFSEVEANGGIAQLVVDYRTGDLRDKLARHHHDNVDPMFEAWAGIWQAPAMRSWSMTERLQHIRAPLLLIQGEADEHGSLRQIETIVSETGGPTDTLLLSGCGHIPHLERPQAVVERVASFLGRSLERPAPPTP